MKRDIGVCWIKISLFLALVLQGGCETTTHTFKVNAMRNPDVEDGRSYRIVSSHKNTGDETDPQFQEVSEYVKTALSGKGYYEAPEAEDADLIINIAYGTAPPNVSFKAVNNPAAPGSIHNPIGRSYPGSSQYPRRRYPGGGSPTIGGGTMGQPQTSQNEVIPVTTYEKYLQITAIDNRTGNSLKDSPHVWQVTVKNRDESDDIDKYLPLMAAASIEYVGERTESQEVITLKESDRDVAFVKANGAEMDREQKVSKFQ